MRIKPGLSPHPELTAYLGARVTPALRADVEAIADAEGTRLTDVLRACLEAGVAEWQRDRKEAAK